MTLHYSPARLRSARKAAGKSQCELAEKIGQSQQAVSTYERTTEPPLSIGVRICRALGLELTDLLQEFDSDGSRPA